MFENIHHFKRHLSNEKNILLFPLFSLPQDLEKPCISKGNCTLAYSLLNVYN